MRAQLAPSIALAAALSTALPVSAGDFGGVVLGRRSGPDGALLVAPVPDGVRGRGGYVVVTPSVAPRGDLRYGRALPGYLGGHYATSPGSIYVMPDQDRLYCPESRAYYPTVQECATPWLRLRPGGGVSAESPIPAPAGQYYGR